jgi:phenylpropionate dioxygenase-like ring-hydroxylating dioxygenase large terminal subunit
VNKPEIFSFLTGADDVRDDWIPKDAYHSVEFAELERERLWPRVWQVACREEEIPKVGDFVTYDILDDSIIIVRTAKDTIKAYNNACLHRGRRLTEGAGHTARFLCRFHGWQWKLNGENALILDKEDWGDRLECRDMSLKEYKVGSWGGFVFVNMDPDCEPLETYLAPVPEYIGWMEFEKQRYRWYVSLELEANWKTAQEAFEEAYHVAATHRRYAHDFDPRAKSCEHGRHGQLNFRPLEEQSPGIHVGGPNKGNRESVMSFIRGQARDLRSIYTDRDLQAASRIMTELPNDATYLEALAKANEFIKEAAIASGAGFPDVSDETMGKAGFDWTIFPNLVNVIPSATCGFWYRTRPTRDNDPNRCTVEMYALERFAPGTEPVLERKYYKSVEEWIDMPIFLKEDFENIPEVQRGIRTRGWEGATPNPLQERAISNFHKVLRKFIFED